MDDSTRVQLGEISFKFVKATDILTPLLDTLTSDENMFYS